jgi:hypothetical protein
MCRRASCGCPCFDEPRATLYRRTTRLPVAFISPCLPTKAPQPPTGDAWVREIKHNGFRVIAGAVTAECDNRVLAAEAGT